MQTRRYFFRTYLLGILIMIGLTSCAQQETAVTIFHGGTIMTVDSDFSEVEAVAIEGDKIVATGDLSNLQKEFGKQASIIDLEGKTMLPGFIDPHAHVLTFAPVRFLTENIGVDNFRTTQEALDHLKQIASKKEKGEWIAASGWDPSVQEGVSAITNKELDQISTEHPIFILNTSGHLAYINSLAFEAAGIDENTPNPPGAEYVKDQQGKLTGVVKNNIAFFPVWLANPAASQLNMEDAIVSLLNEFNQYGLTTTSEFSLGITSQGPADFDLLLAAAQREDFTARIMAYPWYTLEEKWNEAGTKMYDGNDLVKIVGYKLVADGSNQGYTGFQREEFYNEEQKGNLGKEYMTVDEMYRQAKIRAEQGWHMALHGNGDAGIDNVLTVMQMLKDDGIDVAKLRPRIEHCSILHDDQIEKMKDLGVSASFLIGHVHYWGTAMRDEVFGPEKALLLDRTASVEKAGVGYTLHSDFAVTEPNMLKLIEIAVTRTTFKEPDFVLNPAERVSVESAIRAVTSEAAWQMMVDNMVGSLEVGKYADFVILEDDPRKVEPSTISEIKVVETWMNGKQVYENK
ncbi:amidohydrolase [Carboxylicivirga mesophila]|uniref:Amidohydrolase n=1 Tax=Carboxylicivirga mesophila TaxID=1166478 RepID=A0ABS5KAG8_9BACT|nr:amidohydrolase [Carboxylicivirga mesophila]MBS2211971.1 amidohydrolase [Carboxylicivirga mesophila]